MNDKQNLNEQLAQFTKITSTQSKETSTKSGPNEIYQDFTPIQKTRTYHRPFGKFKRKTIFILIFFINILINVDHGAIPAATTILKRENNLDNVSLGIIGSLVYLGLVLGAISASIIFAAYSSKWVVLVSLLFSCMFLYFFTVAETELPLAVCRTGCGFFQVFSLIYFPVWVDQFGVSNGKTLWLTFLQLGVPIGTMIGYVMEAYFVNKYENWRGCFYTQIMLLLTASMLFALTPDKFFSRNYKKSETPMEEIKQEFETLKEAFEKEDKLRPTGKTFRNIHLVNAICNNKYGRPSLYSMFSLIEEPEDSDQYSYFSVILDLLSNKVYLFTMLAICCLLFIITGIQFWISDYMQVVLLIDPKEVFITFSIVCITAPVLGVLMGGCFIQKLGGYTDRRALNACFKISLMAAASGIFLPIINFVPLFVLLMWLLLFFGGSIVPGLTGIMLSSNPEKTKEIANSVTQLCSNLFGYLPSPFLYGLVCKLTGGSTSRYGLAFILLWSVFGVFFLFLAKCSQDRLYATTSEYRADNNAPFEISSNATISRNKTLEEKSGMLTTIFGRYSLQLNSDLR